MKYFLALVVVCVQVGTGVLGQGSPVHHVKTAADLVALNIPNVSTRLSALLTGVATENDGKGGLFFYQASSAVATNAHSIFKPAGSGGRWLRASMNISEEDGSPSVLRATGIKVTNGTMTDNGDGTVSIATGSTSGGGSAPVGTVIQDNGATSAFFPPVFESISGTNLIQALYGYPFNSDPLTPANSTNFNFIGILTATDYVNYFMRSVGMIDLFGEATPTIASGVITLTDADGPWVSIQAETGSADDLVTIVAPTQRHGVNIHHLLNVFSPLTGDTITFKHGVNNIFSVSGNDIVLSVGEFAIGVTVGTNWLLMSTADLAPVASPSFAGTATFGTGNGNINVGATGFNITSDGDGGGRFLGLGDGSDEDWSFNLDDTPNVIAHSSGTGVTIHRWTGIGMEFGGTISPITSDVGALGTGALMWADLFLASGGVINWNNGDVLLTHSADTLTMSGGTWVPGLLRYPNSASDATLATAGDTSYNTTDEQLSFHSAADGEISGEVAISAILHKTWSFDPDAICDGAVDRLFLMTIGDDLPEGMIIDEWKVSFEADPTTEVDLDLKFADAYIGVANATVIDVLDTTAGVSAEDTDANINGGAAVANGKVLYLEFGTAYTESNHQIIFEIYYHAEED